MPDSDDLSNVFDSTDGNDPIDQNLTDLFNAMTADATAEELAGQESIVTAMLAAMQPVPSNVIPLGRSTMRNRFATSKAATKAAIISGVVLFSATAAAATGALPDSAQSFVARSVDHVGIHVENPDKSANDALEASSTSTTIDDNSATESTVESGDDKNNSAKGNDDSDGADVSGNSKFGLCRSFTEHQNDPSKIEDSIGHKSLQDAATAAQQTIVEFCASTTSSSIDDHGKSTNSGNSGNSGTSGNSGGSDDTTESTTPTVTVPGADDPTDTSSSLPDDGAGHGANSGKDAVKP